MNKKIKGKNITLSEQFLNLIQKSWKEEEIGMPTTFIHASSFFCAWCRHFNKKWWG